MGEAENQVNDLEHEEAKNNQSEQQEERRIQKKEDSVRSTKSPKPEGCTQAHSKTHHN